MIRSTLAFAAASFMFVNAMPAAAADAGDDSFSFAVLGDTPNNPTFTEKFPQQVQEMNRDSSLEFVAHVGDIKNGSQRCNWAYFKSIRDRFDEFAAPVVFTPGDNDWVDCHRDTNGGYNPMERLTVLRNLFFDQRNRTLGQDKRYIPTQVDAGYPENSSFHHRGVSFAVINVTGSGNGLAPWYDWGYKTANARQTAELEARTANNIKVLRESFDRAKRENHPAVVILTHADMFGPGHPNPTANTHKGYRSTVAEIARLSRDFGKPVYLINGDSHEYNSDDPLAAGSRWLGVYGQEPVPNLHRITVDGDNKANNYLKITVGPQLAGAAGSDTTSPARSISHERVSFAP